MRFVLLLLPLLLGACDLGLGGEDECQGDGDCGKHEWCRSAFLFGGSECRPFLRKGAACADAIDPCRPELRCNRAYEPARCRPPEPIGGRCDSPYDCADADAICNHTVPDAASVCTLPGTVPEGGGCWNPAVCMAGLGCAMSVCSPPGGVGDWCSGNWPVDVPPCEEGLYCSWAKQICLEPGAEDAPCAQPNACVEGLICHYAGAEPACRAPSAEGEPCGMLEDCIEGLGLICHHGGDAPACRPPSDEGEPCARRDDCAGGTGLVCGTAGACRQPAALGEACAGNADCGWSDQCVLATCADHPLPTGGACELDDQCRFGDFCGDGTCTGRLPRGTACDRNAMCSSYCRDGACA